MSEELKPCPFCGGKAVLLGGPQAQECHSVWCLECSAKMQGGMQSEPLVEKWNARPAPAVQVPDAVEVLAVLDDIRSLDPTANTLAMAQHIAGHLAGRIRHKLAAATTPAPVATEAVYQLGCKMYGPAFGEEGRTYWIDCDKAAYETEKAAGGPCRVIAGSVATEAVAQNARDAAFIDVVTYGQGFLQIGADGMETHIPAESVVHEAVAQECFTHGAQADGVPVVPKAMYDQLMSNYIALSGKAVAQGGGVDVEKVMALVRDYGHKCAEYGCYGPDLENIRAILASAPAVPVGDGCDSEVIAQFLYGLLDDIDTASDMAKSDDSAYRKLVERIQARKREVVAECDGYTVKFKTPAPAATKEQEHE